MSTPFNSPPSTALKPYLELRHRLSLAWIAFPVISLLFVAFRLQQASASSQAGAENAKEALLASCKAAERAATGTASMPRYLAAATNRQFVEAVQGTIDGARAAMVAALTAIEAILNFVLDIYRSTLLCFVEFAVRGGLAVLITATQAYNAFVTSSMATIRASIQGDIDKANAAIRSAVDGLNTATPFGGDIQVPQFDIPSLGSMDGLQLPDTFTNALTSFRDTLPTSGQLKDRITDLIDTPFEIVKKEINDTFSGITVNFTTLPLPSQNTVEFCQDLDTSVIDDLVRDLRKLAFIGTFVVIGIAVFLIISNCVLQWRSWRSLKANLERTREMWYADPNPTDANLLMIQFRLNHPILARLTSWIARVCRLSPSQLIHLQWFFSYVFYPAAFACFVVGFFGFASIQLQLFLIRPLVNEYSHRSAASATDFSNKIATFINDTMYNQSAGYASDVNGRANAMQTDINDKVFGWVNGTLGALNSTLVLFYNDVEKAVDGIFGNSPFADPAHALVQCFIGSKVEAIEEAVGFLRANLQVFLPRLDPGVLLLSQESVDEVTGSLSNAAIGGGNGNEGGVVGGLVNAYIKTLETERFMFMIFMGIWGFVVLMALLIIFWHSYVRPLFGWKTNEATPVHRNLNEKATDWPPSPSFKLQQSFERYDGDKKGTSLTKFLNVGRRGDSEQPEDKSSFDDDDKSRGCFGGLFKKRPKWRPHRPNMKVFTDRVAGATPHPEKWMNRMKDMLPPPPQDLTRRTVAGAKSLVDLAPKVGSKLTPPPLAVPLHLRFPSMPSVALPGKHKDRWSSMSTAPLIPRAAPPARMQATFPERPDRPPGVDPFATPFDDEHAAVAPPTRLQTIAERLDRPPIVDPFITPFDDEHTVAAGDTTQVPSSPYRF